MTPEETNAQLQKIMDEDRSDTNLPYSPENDYRPPVESIYKQRGGNLYLPPNWERDGESEGAAQFRSLSEWVHWIKTEHPPLANTDEIQFLTYTTPSDGKGSSDSPDGYSFTPPERDEV